MRTPEKLLANGSISCGGVSFSVSPTGGSAMSRFGVASGDRGQGASLVSILIVKPANASLDPLRPCRHSLNTSYHQLGELCETHNGYKDSRNEGT